MTAILGFSTARAQDGGSLVRFDRGSNLPVLKFSGTEESFSQVFRMECTDSIPLRIMSMYLVDPESNFSVEQSCDCEELPLTIVPGDLMGIRVTLQANDQNVHYNQVRFILADGEAPINFNIEASRLSAQAGITSPATSDLFTISIMPNPSSGSISITIPGSDRTDIEIFDALGNLIASQSNISSWKWDGLTESGTPVPSGNYFIRALAQGSNGAVKVSTKNVMIAR